MSLTFAQVMTATVTASASLEMKADLYADVLEEMPRQGRWRRQWIPLTTLLASFTVLAAGATGTHWTAGVSAAGLIFDIGGAGIFATGLRLSPRAVTEMGTPRWDGNEIPRIYWQEAQQDLRVGLALLVIGFALQALGVASASR